jgi:hypothetical protein
LIFPQSPLSQRRAIQEIGHTATEHTDYTDYTDYGSMDYTATEYADYFDASCAR